MEGIGQVCEAQKKYMGHVKGLIPALKVTLWDLKYRHEDQMNEIRLLTQQGKDLHSLRKESLVMQSMKLEKTRETVKLLKSNIKEGKSDYLDQKE